MDIDGSTRAEHVVPLFLSREYAFEIEYLNKIIRIAHSRGVWTFAKLVGTSSGQKIDDTFSWSDSFSGCTAENEVTQALIDQTIFRLDKGGGVDRETEARVICEVLKIWGGNFSKILRIHVLQPGRDGTVHSETGEFKLRPKEEEFKKW